MAPYAAAASRFPATYPSCSSPEKNPRPSAGSDSSASAAPTPHSPPIAMPNNARDARNSGQLGENADASSNTEKQTMFAISTGRRPNFSASQPNNNAPTG